MVNKIKDHSDAFVFVENFQPHPLDKGQPFCFFLCLSPKNVDGIISCLMGKIEAIRNTTFICIQRYPFLFQFLHVEEYNNNDKMRKEMEKKENNNNHDTKQLSEYCMPDFAKCFINKHYLKQSLITLVFSNNTISSTRSKGTGPRSHSYSMAEQVHESR